MPISDGFPHVQGHCPACGSTSLFVGSGGYITCSVIGCPDPAIVTDLLEAETEHIVIFDEESFSVKHPLRERKDSDLFDCLVHSRIAAMDGPPPKLGRYRLHIDGDRWLWQKLMDVGETGGDDE